MGTKNSRQEDLTERKAGDIIDNCTNIGRMLFFAFFQAKTAGYEVLYTRRRKKAIAWTNKILTGKP